MDNEASSHLKTALLKKDISHQLIPPHCHRDNLSKRAIQIFKNHLKAGLATTDPDYPTTERSRLIPQVEVTSNFLRAIRVIPRLSVYAYIFRQFDFSSTPMAPPGTKVLAHLKPGQRSTWTLHWEEGWTTGPVLHHYRCIHVTFQ